MRSALEGTPRFWLASTRSLLPRQGQVLAVQALEPAFGHRWYSASSLPLDPRLPELHCCSAGMEEVSPKSEAACNSEAELRKEEMVAADRTASQQDLHVDLHIE